MGSYKLDEWIPIENTHLTDYSELEIKQVMFKIFDENCKEGVCTASTCFKKNDGTVTGFYHPPKSIEFEIHDNFLFKKE